MNLKQLFTVYLVAWLGLPLFRDYPLFWIIMGWGALTLVFGYFVDRKYGKGTFGID